MIFCSSFVLKISSGCWGVEREGAAEVLTLVGRAVITSASFPGWKENREITATSVRALPGLASPSPSFEATPSPLFFLGCNSIGQKESQKLAK